ncbi:MAG TPA: type I-U CRISPR-associated helicase/endonuclease Cas3 [Pirellulales bacterium]|nr:type I-U CRISPR-associated helicase/endonuclease Cas3 [Pirellulales bacterium]
MTETETEPISFEDAFFALTGNKPFPWQRELYRVFVEEEIPSSCNIPTGLGKTAIIIIWILARASRPQKVPRRLVYVVNRRTVVDQSTDEAKKLHKNLPKVPDLQAKLGGLAISTLRGQFADNREWSADPSRPAVIVGTVDMIGSRLLFSGYGLGFKSKPLHAGFLGQDVLLVHDEAHLEPAFQALIVAIQKEQDRCKEFAKFHVMELTATPRGVGDVYELTTEEKNLPDSIPDPPEKPIDFVWQRIKSKKGLKFHPDKRDSVAKKIGELARQRWKDSKQAILIFVRTIDDVRTVQAILTDKKNGGVPDDQVQQLTGTLRGLERDELATRDPVFARFMPKPKVTGKDATVYLICTSAGEVGVDISADHMVCDLTTLDSMAQRFGRVNRRGEGHAEIDLIYETDPNPKPPSPSFEAARWRTKAALERLTKCDWIEDRYDASPAALGALMRSLTEAERDAAFAPPPIILPTTDILFDSWALTTIKDKLPGRPKVEPYLHGLVGWEPPETHVAWREEVSRLAALELTEKELGEILDDYQLKPHELLREPSYRAFKQFEAIAKRCPEAPVWLVDDDGKIEVLTMKVLADKDEKERIEGKTVLLPPSAGGLKAGMLDGGSPTANDVADVLFVDEERTQLVRVRVEDREDERAKNMRLIRRIDFTSSDDDEDAEGKSWYWFGVNNYGEKTAKLPVLWRVHVDDVIGHARTIVANLPLDQKLKDAIIVAAQLHDHGKKRRQFQTVLSNRRYPAVVLAKSGKKGGRIAETYRHEFGSLLEVANQPELNTITDPDMKELVLHLIAAHHGRARPHFPQDEAFDPEPPTGSNPTDMAMSVPRRFARLQRKYGRWGLAYLESLLRAADWAASGSPSEFWKEGES